MPLQTSAIFDVNYCVLCVGEQFCEPIQPTCAAIKKYE